ncbi:hypothetical protein MRX96_034984 [Rhipicephalus microplus]
MCLLSMRRKNAYTEEFAPRHVSSWAADVSSGERIIARLLRIFSAKRGAVNACIPHAHRESQLTTAAGAAYDRSARCQACMGAVPEAHFHTTPLKLVVCGARDVQSRASSTQQRHNHYVVGSKACLARRTRHMATAVMQNGRTFRLSIYTLLNLSPGMRGSEME